MIEIHPTYHIKYVYVHEHSFTPKISMQMYGRPSDVPKKLVYMCPAQIYAKLSMVMNGRLSNVYKKTCIRVSETHLRQNKSVN